MAQSAPGPDGTGLALTPGRRVREVESRVLRGVLGRFATGITVLTVGGATPHGMTANAFTSVSLDPPLVLVCVGREAVMHESILGARGFAVSVLHGDQETVARYFADRRRPRGAAQFAAFGWVPGPVTGAPLLVGGLAWVECALEDSHRGGDHSIFVGRVLGTARSDEHDALLFFGGGYHRLVCD
jgi:flavin reductase (DIM6/NTAB) family NADH-FMN oxidoreductase RutF